ncbi:hypothetical protein FN976_16300 [Caenimonas sedimenti]|uniref:Uncharacterized protein n=1 Tax=Caenimonas sedimenti TaxID=2596921 RepID=A0A562ZMU6_9BURK|nr:hypothetical protein [Caenimonas sedimenti]TWO69912.1 hypothetical protein FN976_16300 [Caenimonas sedimenti]
MLGKLIAFAISSGLAKKAWDHYQATSRGRGNVSDVKARPVAAAKPRAASTKAKKAPASRSRKAARPSA